MNDYRLALELQVGQEIGFILDRGSFSMRLAGTLRHKGRDRYEIASPSGSAEFDLLHVRNVRRVGERIQIMV